MTALYPAMLPPDAPRPAGGLLGAIGFGATRPAWAADAPFATVGMAGLDRPGWVEAWIADAEMVRDDRAGIAVARAGSLGFGVLTAPGDAPPDDAARDLYGRMLEVLRGGPHPHLLRVWNYLPAITGQQDGAERYHRFNAGRHDAFAAHGALLRDPPAASALGSAAGDFVLYVLSGAEPGAAMENPRQVSAYHYPPQYGPRSPLFARSLLHRTGFYVSGTASIVGHESWHPGDVAAQTGETIRNLRALLDGAAARGFQPRTGSGVLKAYIRHPADTPGVMAALAEAFPGTTRVALRADICRPELLVEVEAAFPA